MYLRSFKPLSQMPYKKFLMKRPLTLVSLVFIIACTVISICAYLIIPDNSPSANNQLPEIALKPPGFHSDVLKMRIENSESQDSWFTQAFTGFHKDHYELPYKDIQISGDLIELTTHYEQKKFIPLDEIALVEIPGNTDVLTWIKNNYSENKVYYLGTDKYGRSILSRLILGIRVSLAVGLLAVFISITVGIIIGAVAGYLGGWVDQVAMYFINVTWSIPTLLLVFAIVLAFGRSVSVIFLAVGLTMWVDVARIVRGQVKKVREEQYVMAGKSLGYSMSRILARHILPNIIGPILVIAAANFATAILLEAGLSYLGFGIAPPAPSIGNMLNENYGYALSNKPFLAIIPAITIMLLVLSFNLIGSGFRDYFDVKETS